MSWLHAARERVLDAVRGVARDRELDEEIGYHLELEAARQRAGGLGDTDARARALARFGDPARIKEATRDARGDRPLAGALQDLRWALRRFGAQPAFTALALLTLALGIGATSVAFTVLDTVLLRPLPYTDAGRLVLVRERTEGGALRAPSYPNFVDWRAQARTFAGVAAMTFPRQQALTGAGDPVMVPMAGVSRGFFTTLGVSPVLGREFTAAEQQVGGPLVVMVTHELWRTALGGRTTLGTVRLDDTPWQVVGVLPPGVRLPADAQLLYPDERSPGTVRSSHNHLVVGRLAPGATLASARAEMTTLSQRLLATYGTDTEAADADVTPLREYLVGDYRTMLGVVFGAAALVLLIASTNLVSAQLARGLTRQREIAVRAALGASRGRLVRQLLVESAALTAGGALLGTLVAWWLTRGIRVVGGGLVPRLDELAVDGRTLGFVAALAVLVALLVGVYPALRLAARHPGDALRGGARQGGDTTRSGVWALLVGFEMAMALVLLVGSALLVRTMHNILSSDVGFEPRGVATATLAPDGMPLARIEALQAEIAALPGVEGAAFTSLLPLEWGSMSAPVLRPGDPPDRDWPAFAGVRVVSPDYFAVLRQPVQRGRAFTRDDRAGTPPVAIVTPGIAARLWPGQDPIGQRIRTTYLADQWLTVVGVVAEASSWTMPRGSQNEIYLPFAQQLATAAHEGWPLIAVARTAGDARAALGPIRTRLQALVPGVPVRVGTLEQRIAASAADRRFAMVALVAFGAIALVLAMVGIYGVMSYSVATRSRELGVRMALGASPRAVMRQVLGGAAAMSAGGIAVGALAGLVATRWLQSVLYGVSRFDPTAYAIGAGVLLAAGLLGAYVPARRSARVDPLVTMRGE